MSDHIVFGRCLVLLRPVQLAAANAAANTPESRFAPVTGAMIFAMVIGAFFLRVVPRPA
jgi:hypothetical protein